MEGDRLKVVVCDDSEADARRVAACASGLCARIGCGVALRVYTDASLLLDEWACDADFLFLDVEMPLVDGMGVAREVRGRDAGVSISFVTSYERYALGGYEVGALRYVLKPVSQASFDAAFGEAFRQALLTRAPRLVIRTDTGLRRLSPAHILFVETARNHRLVAHTDEGPITCYGSLARAEGDLRACSFFRCHTSYLVNLARVSAIGPSSVTMGDGSELPVSRHRRAELLRAFLAYAKGVAGEAGEP